MALLEGRNLRKTYRLSRRNSVDGAARRRHHASSPARWSPSWARPARARAP